MARSRRRVARGLVFEGQLQNAGEIIPQDQIDKIVALDRAFIDLKATLSTAAAGIMSGFVDEFDKFQKSMGDQNFQNAMQNFGKLLADLVGDLPKIAPFLPALAGAIGGAYVGGAPGAVVGALGGAIGGSQIGKSLGNSQATKLVALQQQIAQLKDATSTGLAGYLPGAGLVEKLFGSDADIAKKKAQLAGLEAQYAALQKQIAGGSTSPAAATTPVTTPGSGGMPAPNLTDDAFTKAVRQLQIQSAAIKDGTGEYADYTEAQQAAAAATRLTTAAEQDAVTKGVNVKTYVAALAPEIDDLSKKYGMLRANQAWAGDMAAEDDRINKLKEEAAQYNMTAAAVATLQEREKLLADFHAKKGKNGDLNAIDTTDAAGRTYQQVIDQKSHKVGDAAAQSIFNQSLKGADDQIKGLTDQSAQVGLYNGALAQAQMQTTLLYQATQAGQPIGEKELEAINQRAKAYGDLTDSLVIQKQNESNLLEVTTSLETGLDNVAVAGVQGFKSMKTAAADLLEQIAQLIVKLYVMQPILNSLFGQAGTTGGGLLGGFLGDLTGAPGTAASFGLNPSVIDYGFAGGGYTGSGGKRQVAGFVTKARLSGARMILPGLAA